MSTRRPSRLPAVLVLLLAVSLEGTRGSPSGGSFTVLLRIETPSTFALNVESIDSYLDMNDTRYGLLRTEGSTEIRPGSAETISLTVEQSTAKTLSMNLNIAQSGSLQFALGRDIRCQTPYGLIFIPLRLDPRQGA